MSSSLLIFLVLITSLSARTDSGAAFPAGLQLQDWHELGRNILNIEMHHVRNWRKKMIPHGSCKKDSKYWLVAVAAGFSIDVTS